MERRERAYVYYLTVRLQICARRRFFFMGSAKAAAFLNPAALPSQRPAPILGIVFHSSFSTARLRANKK